MYVQDVQQGAQNAAGELVFRIRVEEACVPAGDSAHQAVERPDAQ